MACLEIERYEVVAGHHTPEDRPDLIAAAVVGWMGRHGLDLK
jgi:haloalkane dehalogenase